jgi:Predicted membrane protein/domain
MSQVQSVSTLPPAGLFSRLGALVSDSFVVFGLLALSTLFLFVPVLSMLGKKAMTPSEVGWAWSLLYFAVMLSVWFGFYGYFWTRSGQTIGMRAWRIRVESQQAGSVKWSQALKRWLSAAVPWLPCFLLLILAEREHSKLLERAGQGLSLLGFAAWLVMYADPAKRTWHDRTSNTRVIKLPKL